MDKKRRRRENITATKKSSTFFSTVDPTTATPAKSTTTNGIHHQFIEGQAQKQVPFREGKLCCCIEFGADTTVAIEFYPRGFEKGFRVIEPRSAQGFSPIKPQMPTPDKKNPSENTRVAQL